MGQPETNLRNTHTNGLTRWQRLWRCNSGAAWGGEFLKPSESFRIFGVRVPLLRNLRKIELWPVGAPDLCGFDSVVITPEMVGRRVAVFVGAEIKAGDDKMKPEQKNWRDLIVRMGGVHREVRESEVIESGFNVRDGP